MGFGKKNTEHYSIKCKLEGLLQFKEWKPIIQKRVDIVNKIWVEAYFLFNLYIFHYLEKNKCPSFNDTTICRCVLFVLGIKNKIRKDNDDEYKNIDYVYTNIYLKIGDPNISQYSKLKSIVRPFEFLSQQMLVNIHNHIKLNFGKFQKKYLKTKVFNRLIDIKLKKNIMYAVLGCVQYHINNDVTTITVRSRLINKHKDLKLIIPIIQDIILEEKENVPKSIRGNTTYKNLKLNYKDVIPYFQKMVKYLEDNEKKRFSILPQINFGYTYIKFDSRLLSVIFDEWIDNLKFEIDELGEKQVISKYDIWFDVKKVGIKSFEENYKLHYKRCFNLDKFQLHNKNGEYDNPISIATNGYTACVLFERNIPKDDSIIETNNTKDKHSTKINLDTYFNKSNNKDKLFKKGLFDADNCKASEEFLNKFNKTSIDPNNDAMLYCYDESGKVINITKGFYLEKSHIKQNANRMKRYIKQYKMDILYQEMSKIGHKSTASNIKYIEFIKKYRSNRDKIWRFYSRPKILRLEFDTYIHKKKTINKIVRRIVPKKNKHRKYKNYKNKNIDNAKYKENINKPHMVFFGKGNGSTTISNLKNSGPKGPIKTIAKKLSNFCPTILTDEYCTSQVCSVCGEKHLEYPIMKHIKTIRVIDKKTGKRKKKLVISERKSHRLCCCDSNNHPSNKTMDSHKIWWNRDYNSSRDILKVGQSKLLGKRLGIFSRRKKEDYNNDSICFSLERQDTEKGIQIMEVVNTAEMEVSRKTKIQVEKSTIESNEKQLTKSKNKTVNTQLKIKISKTAIKKIANKGINIV